MREPFFEDNTLTFNIVGVDGRTSIPARSLQGSLDFNVRGAYDVFYIQVWDDSKLSTRRQWLYGTITNNTNIIVNKNILTRDSRPVYNTFNTEEVTINVNNGTKRAYNVLAPVTYNHTTPGSLTGSVDIKVINFNAGVFAIHTEAPSTRTPVDLTENSTITNATVLPRKSQVWI